MNPPSPESWREELKTVLERRESRMHDYYKSVFVDDFSGGYPMDWDSELESLVASEITRARESERVKILAPFDVFVDDLKENGWKYEWKPIEVAAVLKSIINSFATPPKGDGV